MGKIIKEKKGIFFTFIAITIIAVFTIVFTPQADVSLQKDTQAIRARINSIDNYVDDLEGRYFETALRAATYKAMLSLIFYINETDLYLTDMNSAFYEVMLNGSILNPGQGHVPIDSITKKNITENNTLLNWSNKIIDVAKDTLNVNTSITILNVTVNQTKPWSIDSTLRINFSVKSNVAEWKKNATITTTISIEGFYDPYYLVNTNGLYTNQIKESSVSFNQWNLSKVREHLRNGTYVYWQNSDAPSFLMRFTNTISPSRCCGIESLVNPNKITTPDQIDSYADYILWDPLITTPCSQLYNITNPLTGQGLWDEFRYFKLDFEHVTKYNITSEYAVKTCQ
ncbi:hypothetical protein HYX00_00730 [Candidatus Woesearchaeota archaeon]|nr:hypothetical protein [Candidatus Woesearchaeota archaeon]